MESKKKKDIDLGISVKKDENFSEWYTQVLQKADVTSAIMFIKQV